MHLHLDNSVGMLGLGAYLCKSQGDSHNTEPATDTGGHISPPAQQLVRKNVANIKDVDQVSKYGRWSDRVKEICIELEVNINAWVYSIGDVFSCIRYYKSLWMSKVWLYGCNVIISETMMKSLNFFIWIMHTVIYKVPHTKHKLQMCLFTIKTQLTRGNNTECVKALHGERRTKPIFVSQLALPPDWAAPLCETSHRKTLPFCIQQATLMCKCMQEHFRKAKITEPNEVAALKLSGLWIITTCFMELSSISCETMTSVV